MKKFKFSLWPRSKNRSSKPLGKSYRLKDGELITEDVSANADYVQVVEIESLDDLEFEIDFNMHDGNGFMTSGVPKTLRMAADGLFPQMGVKNPFGH